MLSEIIWIAIISSMLTLLSGWLVMRFGAYCKNNYFGARHINSLRYQGLLAELKLGDKE